MDKMQGRPGALARWLVIALCAAVVFTSMGLAADARSYDEDKIDPLLARDPTARGACGPLRRHLVQSDPTAHCLATSCT